VSKLVKGLHVNRTRVVCASPAVRLSGHRILLEIYIRVFHTNETHALFFHSMTISLQHFFLALSQSIQKRRNILYTLMQPF
jgi:hypothetical protein